MDLRLPNITASTDKGQIEQIKSYLYQLVRQLEWIFSTFEHGDGQKSSLSTDGDITSILAAIKPLIIDASEISNAYYEQMKPNLKKDFVQRTEHESVKKEVGALDKRIEAAEKSLGKFDNLHYSSAYIGANTMKIAAFDVGMSIFIFGQKVYGIIYINNDGTAGFSGSEGVSSVTYEQGIVTLELAEGGGRYAAFSADDFEIL